MFEAAILAYKVRIFKMPSISFFDLRDKASFVFNPSLYDIPGDSRSWESPEREDNVYPFFI